jgi:hypothetical protein
MLRRAFAATPVRLSHLMTRARDIKLEQFTQSVELETERLKGKVGDGPNIKLTANRGWISVRKEGTMPSEVLPDTPGDGRPRPPQPPKPPKSPKDLRDSEIKM